MFNFNKFKHKCKFWFKKYQYRNKYDRDIYLELLREEFNLFKKDKYIEQYYKFERYWLLAGYDLNSYMDKMYNIFVERKCIPICEKLGYLYPDLYEVNQESYKTSVYVFKVGITAPNLIMYIYNGENPYEGVYLNFMGFITK